MAHILVVEDEPKVARLLLDYLAHENHQARWVDHGDAVMTTLQEAGPFDAILLDLMLPGTSGIELCKQIRQRSTIPILMITAKVDEIDRLLGLELGADDYICKPFSPREVMARLKAVLRRSQMASHPAADAVPADGLQLLPEQLALQWQGRNLTLSVVEFRLMELLAGHPGRIFSRDALIDKIYPDNRIVSDRTIDSHIKKLRKKLAEVGLECIHSVYGAGYKFEPPEQGEPQEHAP